ncbi:MAG: DUF4156 domain-containing protein [Deltaproteobacteria bacterium]|nr:DUF4156 domain-containing protein [Deltaproteobacteria bacterium]
MRRISLFLLTAILLAACQWVKLSPEGERVRVGNAAEVASCTKLGEVSGRTTVTVGPAARNEAKIATEIETLARNEAATLKGNPNVIVPLAPVDWDHRDYAAYRCD